MRQTEEKLLKEYIVNIVKSCLNETINNISGNEYSNIYNAESDILERKKPSKNKTSKQKNEPKNKGKKDNLKNKRAQVISRLRDDGVNSAEYMRELWHPEKEEEDAKRSLFYKKRDGKKNESGVPYSFSTSEIIRLYHLLTTDN